MSAPEASSLSAVTIVDWNCASPQALQVCADPQFIFQMLLNPVRNAVEALSGQADCAIEIRAFQDGYGHTQLIVADNGPGMVKEAIDRVVVPLCSTKRTGFEIGLSLSLHTMRTHHGSLSVMSDPGRRTEFAMTF